MDYLLGLDIGSASIGWALLSLDGGRPAGILRTGVRVFESGMEGDIEAGQAESRGIKRRAMRALRRLTERRARRMRKLLGLLQRNGLLPPGAPGEILPALDRELQRKHGSRIGDAHPPYGGPPALAHTLPYWLRARALDQRLEPHELGRALYHLAQRRGFLSNRRAPKKKDEKPGEVQGGISDLQARMAQAGARTLGEYFASLDPQQERIRNRYTSRRMYEDEFDMIWSAQAAWHSAILTDDLKARVHRAIFYQRPLQKQAGLIGHCELEPEHRRAPWALVLSQRFRLLQQVNNTRVITPQGEERPLTPDERTALIQKLETDGDVTFAAARRALRLPRGTSFNWESGGEKRFLGNRTNDKLAAVFGPRWWELSADERDRVVEDLLSFEKEDALARHAANVWALPQEASDKLAKLELEAGYCRHSRQALRKLVPLLEQGLTYMEAADQAYPHHRDHLEAMDALPPVSAAVPELRNPAVYRALTELRRLVTAVVGRYGKPSFIRIELARELRKPARQRRETWKRNRANEQARQQAAARICAETGNEDSSPRDIQKILLADECNWHCPYTGKGISMPALVGPNPQFDTEHIIPFDRCLDDSFFNKTLCEVQENRARKRSRTPYEAYGADAHRYEEIIQRVRDFQGAAAWEKLRRFQLKETEGFENLVTRHLNDTKYAATLATQYLALLYGGLTDKSGKRRIQASSGGVTAHLRSFWGLNAILGPPETKSRDDHRHHAVDGVVIALTDAHAVKSLSDAARTNWRWWRADVPPPWEGFGDEVRQHIAATVVSHRTSRKVSGPLHEETIYSPPRDDEVRRSDGGRFVHVRKRLDALSLSDVPDIVDTVVRDRVAAKLEELGIPDPRKAFADSKNLPFLAARDGRRIPIKKTRIRRSESTFRVGSGPRERHVVSEVNHHIEVYETTDRDGNARWTREVVSQYEALRRLSTGEVVVRRKAVSGGRFVFSLACGETIELDDEARKRGLYVVRSVSKDPRVVYVHANDARKVDVMRKSDAWYRHSVEQLRKLNCRKVTVTPLGEVRTAHD